MILKNTKDISIHIMRFQEKVRNCLITIKNEFNIAGGITQNMMNEKPFSKKYSKEFFTALKVRDNKSVLKYLDLNPYLVYDVNSVYLTITIDETNWITYCG